MQIFWAEKSNESQAWLDEAETKHCIKVLRHKVGDHLDCIDGQGWYLKGEVVGFAAGRTELNILEQIENWGEHESELILAVSPLRLRDRFEWLVEKAVELGVNQLVPLRCTYTDVYRAKYKEGRILGIMKAALKQCKRSRLPELQPLEDFKSWISRVRPELGLMAHCEADQAWQAATAKAKERKQIHLLIGPEGDFHPEEIALAEERGFVSVHLGANRLRSETAAFHVLSLLKGQLGY
ncbi:MAG: RsmE family RNA methyltransferase [Bacteroidota bacterium]